MVSWLVESDGSLKRESIWKRICQLLMFIQCELIYNTKAASEEATFP